MTERTALSLPQQSRSGPSRVSARAVLSQAGPRATASSLYIHVPFCYHKCHYCDFYSIVDSRDRQDAFVRRLERELTALAPAAEPLETVFVGGGTPSLLRPDLWLRLLGHLSRTFDVSKIQSGNGEFTVECNPETVTVALMEVLRAGGVNRVSMGAQSFNPAHLKTLERWHDPANVGPALHAARRAGIARTSLDLIFAIPGQTLTDWEADLQAALSWSPSHLSCYALTFEQGTAMEARRARGDISPVDEDLEADMFECTGAHLAKAGLHRYEVSNFARAGEECRHNLVYWRQQNWLAAGPSASGHLSGWRWKNSPRLDDYLDGDDDGFSPVIDVEAPDARRGLTERIMTGLRLAEGLPAEEILAGAHSVSDDAGSRLARSAAVSAGRGLLSEEAGRWRLTDRGLLVANTVIIEFISALDQRSRR